MKSKQFPSEVYVLRKRVNLSSESSQPTQERQRGMKALLATEGTLVPQRSLKLAWIMPSDKEESEA